MIISLHSINQITLHKKKDHISQKKIKQQISYIFQCSFLKKINK